MGCDSSGPRTFFTSAAHRKASHPRLGHVILKVPLPICILSRAQRCAETQWPGRAGLVSEACRLLGLAPSRDAQGTHGILALGPFGLGQEDKETFLIYTRKHLCCNSEVKSVGSLMEQRGPGCGPSSVALTTSS